MRISHPFLWLSNSSQKRALAVLIVLSLLVGGAMRVLDSPLRTLEAPSGIVSFELAKTLTQAERILESWDSSARIHAALSLGLDYLYLALYSLCISLLCTRVAGALLAKNALLAVAGLLLAWAQLAAGGLDAVENYALIRLLGGAREEAWSTLAWACALPKFAIVSMGLAYVLVGGIAVMLGRGRGS